MKTLQIFAVVFLCAWGEVLQSAVPHKFLNVEAYFNGQPATDANIVKGVRDMVVNAIKKMGKHR